MAFNDNNESNQNGKVTSSDFLPKFFRTNANKKFLQATFDQLIQPGEAEKIQGYFGRKTAKAFVPSDNYVGDVSADRLNYQLEPAVVVQDEFENTTFYKDYNDYVNQLKVFGADTRDHSRLNSQEFYSWNPNIDWDKFVNFREYYWLPNGPQTVPVRGQAREVKSTYTVTLAEDDDNKSYIFNDGLEKNPTLQLYRGQTYRFEIDVPGDPIAFSISRTFTPGSAILVAGNEGIRAPGVFDGTLYDEEDANYDLGDFIVLPSAGSVSFEEDENVSTLYSDGITKYDEDGNPISLVYIEKGTIEFSIPENAPDRLYYISKNDIDTSGYVRIANIEENTFLNVANDIIGKKTYTSANGVEFTNGLKIRFQGDVEPEIYSSGQWYVEGVGEKIKLVNETDLIIPAQYSEDVFVPYDDDKFDTLPFSNANSYAGTKDYIVINRASTDRNPWSRYNKWFHKSVIEKSAEYNNTTNDTNESFRAKRPIIEFEAGLKLYNYGSAAKTDIDLIDTVTVDAFSYVEGQIGYKIDGIDLADNMRVIFTADTDNLVNGKVYIVKFIRIGNNRQISLVEAEDTTPQRLETVLVTKGRKNAGKSYYYNGEVWKLGQEKTTTNQEPFFDVFGIDKKSFGDTDQYAANTFRGTKLFSYKKGTGSNDSELGFPLSYRNINNSGDILFEFNLLTDSFSYEQDTDYYKKSINPGFLKKYKDLTNYSWVNGYTNNPAKSVQKVLRQYIVTEDADQQTFQVDVYNNAGTLSDIVINVFVNNKIRKDYTLDRTNKKLYIVFDQELEENDVVLIKTKSSAKKNNNGWYDFPINLERNPANADFSEFTLGEVIDHVDTMVEDLREFTGTYPGISNLRDLGDIDRFGKRFVKHSGPINLSSYHVTNKGYNLVKALDHSRREYARFKRNFVDASTKLGVDTETKQHVDAILKDLNKDKVKTEPYYFSDVLAYQSSNTIVYEVFDARGRYYALSEDFNLSTLTNKSVNVYLNGEQLVYGRDYDFSNPGFVYVFADFVEEGDTITVYEYNSTDGSYIPPTPTKLGLYPKFEPELVYDDTYRPEQGEFPEDGTPYKIYAQSEKGFRGENQIGWFYPLYTDIASAQQKDIDEGGTGVAHKHMFKGSNLVLYMPNTAFNHATIDSALYDPYPFGVPMIRGHDGSYVRCYNDYRDKLLLELEKRIFNNIKIEYDSTKLDVDKFVGGEFRDSEFTREEINTTLLRTFSDWLTFLNNDYTDHYFYLRQDEFTFNYSAMNSFQGNSIPGFWRGIFMQLFDTDRPHTCPWEMLGFRIKPKWWNEVYGPAPYTGDNLLIWEDLEQGKIAEPGNVRYDTRYERPGLTSKIPVDSDGNLISPLRCNLLDNFILRPTSDNFAFGDWAPVENAWRRSSEYPFALLTTMVLNKPAETIGLAFDISRTQKNFANQYIYDATSKTIELDQILLPNTVDSNQRIMTAGLVNYISNLISSNVLTVYEDYKNELKSVTNRLGVKIGGFTDKQKLSVILDSRSIVEDQSQDSVFVPQENYDVFLNTSSPTDLVTYSGLIIEKLANGFVIRGYSKSNPYFEYYIPSAGSKKTNITVGGISEVTTQWEEEKPYIKGQVVENNGRYYRVKQSFTSGQQFDTENLALLGSLPIVGGKTAEFNKNFGKTVYRIPYGHRFSSSQEVVTFILGYAERLKDLGFEFNYTADGRQIDDWSDSAKEFLFWTTQGWASGTVLSISASANRLYFDKDYNVVDDLSDPFYGYSVFDENGSPLEADTRSILRDQNSFGIETIGTDHGLYHVALPTVQKEHVVIFDNKTVFNDILYQPSSGYRQERLKVNAYRTADWQGGFNVPGFVFDDARYSTWTEYKDYQIGDLVKYRQYYYVATTNIIGSNIFDNTVWYRLSEEPEKKLLTNFDYRINQFMDFYDLDSVGFDESQQELAQHLVGYQKRQYLANIINDDVSQFKFYNGFIQDKGTANSVKKLFDSLAGNTEEKVELFEEWAVQVGRYGSTENEKQIEYKLTDSKLEESPQIFELANSRPAEFDKIYRIYPSEVYDKPQGYVHTSALPVKSSINEYLKTGGYVNENDVTFVSYDKQELLGADINQVELGSYIWLVETGADDWTVYQIIDTDIKATDFVKETGVFTDKGEPLSELTLDQWTNARIEEKEYFGILNAFRFNISGIYEVYDATLNKIQFNSGEDAINFEDQNFSLVKLRKVRVSNLATLNDLVQEKQYDGQKFWVDNYSNGVWNVVENNPVFSQRQVMSNPSEYDGTNHEFGKNIAVSANNRVLVVASPNDENGKINVYVRPRENSNYVVKQQIQFVDSTLLDVNNTRFGHSVDISPDGEYIVVGMPRASGVKTRYEGDFDPTLQYTKGDVVKYRESIWQALRTINPQTGSQSFTTFDSYQSLVAFEDTDSTNSVLLVAGNPGLPNNVVDHLLVRAPLDMYLGTKARDFAADTPGDQIFLDWNLRSYANPTLDDYYPFDNNLTGITPSWLGRTQGHEIIFKVDYIVYVDTFIALPAVGEFVTTNTGRAEVVYVDTSEDSAVIYVKDTNGVFDISGELFIDDEDFVGLYTLESTYTTSEQVGGYWLIKTYNSDDRPAVDWESEISDGDGFTYDNIETWYDAGRGLVYSDVLLAEGGRDPNAYYNIQTTVSAIGTYILNKNRTSWGTQLSFRGDPTIDENDGQDGFERFCQSNYWVLRVGKEFSDTLNGDETFNLQFYDLENREVDYEAAALTDAIVNAQQTIVDMWDGYIDFELSRFDASGFPFQPQPRWYHEADGTLNTTDRTQGDVIIDVQTASDGAGGLAISPLSPTSAAEVIYLQRDFNKIRVYVKILEEYNGITYGGDFTQLNNIGRYELRRIGNEDLRGAGDVDRTFAEIDDANNDIVVGTTQVGKLLVFQEDSISTFNNNISWEDTVEFIDEEYYFFNENTESGITRPANPPYGLNKDYKQIYHLPANSTGVAGPDLSGAIAIYRRRKEGSYELKHTLTSLFYDENRQFGHKVKLVQTDRDYTLFVGTRGLDAPEELGDSTVGRREHPGEIEIFRHGVIPTDNFAGQYQDRAYVEDEIVIYEDQYFRAIRAVPVGINPQSPEYWNDISWKYGKDINYRGNWDNSYSYAEGSIVIREQTKIWLDGLNGEPLAGQSITFTSVDDSTIIVKTINAVDGNAVIIDGNHYAEFLTFDWSPKSIVTINGFDTITATGIQNVSVIKKLYQAQTNIGVGAEFSNTGWSQLSNKIDYLGYLPNLTGQSLYDEEVFDPVQNIIDFSETFDVSNDRQVLIVKANLKESDSTTKTRLVVYRLNDNKYQLDQVISAPTTIFKTVEEVTDQIVIDISDILISNTTREDDIILRINDQRKGYVGGRWTLDNNLITVNDVAKNDVIEITVYNETTAWGERVSLNDSGDKFAVSAKLDDTAGTDKGVVYIYKQINGRFQVDQILRSPQNEVAEQFGHGLYFGSDNLVVSSLNGDQIIPTTFDGTSIGNTEPQTTFDNKFTSFRNIKLDKGVVYVYEDLENQLVFGEKLIYPSVQTTFGENLFSYGNHIYAGIPRQTNEKSVGQVIDFRKNAGYTAWSSIDQQILPVDVDKISGLMLYNKRKNELISRLDYIDPLQGKIAGVAEQEINYKAGFDPAVYNTGLTNDFLVDPARFWGNEHVGEIWWATNTARFAYPYKGSVNSQKKDWNNLIAGSNIDIFEWVESEFVPSGWDELADTDEGLKKGISGQSLYGNTRYTTQLEYDKLAQNFRAKYYFWVQGKRTKPTTHKPKRKLNTIDIARLIENPRLQGYRYASLISKNTFILNNCNDLIQGDDVVLQIRYKEDETQNINQHKEYQILSEGLESSVLHPTIERKWYDSLIGFDLNNRPVPDINVPSNKRYGIQNVPRQSMFQNRFEALKQTIERANIVLGEQLLIDTYDLSELQRKEPLPSSVSGEFDLSIATYDDLRFVSTNKITQAEIELIISNGRIISTNIINPGRGYKVAPSYNLEGPGSGAIIDFEINSLGQITNVIIGNSGTGYLENTKLIVRPFSVLVQTNETLYGKWAIYSWNGTSWFIRSIQDYDVTNYWDYVDWYADGYNQFTTINYTVPGTYILPTISDRTGDIVKVESVGSGGWVLLEKVANFDTEDYTQNYKVVGRQNGTIQFKETLYNYEVNPVGYSNRSFDSYFYDNNPVTELRIIFAALRDDLLVGDLKSEYNGLFFVGVRYAIAEQKGIDWIFKTSFVKAKYNVSELRNDVTFNSDNLKSFEDYLKEVKPYKTKIREYVDVYSKVEPTNTSVTDFDLPPYYSLVDGSIIPNRSVITDGVIDDPDGDFNSYPRKHFIENVGYQLKEIQIKDGGSGYTLTPKIEIIGDCEEQATAVAYIGYGKITSVKITNPGKGYLTRPIVEITGSQSTGSTPARMSAILGYSPVRTPHIRVKFDRYSGEVYIQELQEVQTFTGNNVQAKFDLEWPMDLDNKKVKVYIDGKEMLRSTYTYENIDNTEKSYSRQNGRITFAKIPATGAAIEVRYYKPIDMLSAQDRIHHFYEPTVGMLGKSFSQLMKGIDYGGVEVKSFGFEGAAGWDTQGWFTDTWDVFDNTYEDEVFVADGSTIFIQLTQPLENGVTYNVYKGTSGSVDLTRIDDPNYGTAQQVNENAIMNSLVGDGVQTIIDLDTLGVSFDDGETIIVRKTTSDGSITPDPTSYDTQLQGGDLPYATAKGVNAEDIIVDGDGFVNPITHAGPEELVPGLITDSLDIKVYTRAGNGNGVIHSQNYTTDGLKTEFDLGVIPSTNEAVWVKVNDIKIADTEYTIDWTTNVLTFNAAPAANQELSIISQAAGYDDLLDYGKTIADGSTTEIITTVDWRTGVQASATVNGEAVEVVVFNSNEWGYDLTNPKVGIRTSEVINEGSVVHYAVLSNSEETNYSRVIVSNFEGDGLISQYTLTDVPFYEIPLEHRIIVKVDNQILKPGYNAKFTIPENNQRTYSFEDFQYPAGDLDVEELKVYLNGEEIAVPSQWRYDVANTSILLTDDTGVPGDTVEIFAVARGDYAFGYLNGDSVWIDTPGTLHLSTIPSLGAKIEIYQFSNHDILGLERVNYNVVNRSSVSVASELTTYRLLKSGIISLRDIAVDAQYVWVSKNGELLTPSVDYYVTDDRSQVRLTEIPANNDVIDLLHFSAPVATEKFAYRQFKDMLNRTHYKRLDKAEVTLRQPLNYSDLRIEVTNGAVLAEPNKGLNLPGIIWINGERIEYFVKEENTLRQLRRGTLGTGVKNIHATGSKVYDQNSSKTVPYQDITYSKEFIADGVTSDFEPGFDIGSINEVEVFVGGRRLRKTSIEVFDPVLAMDSPEGDTTVSAEFSVTDNIITVNSIPVDGEQVMIVKKIGEIWSPIGQQLALTDNAIARFLRAGTSELPE